MSREPGPDNPFDAASYYVEELKYGAGPGTLEVVRGSDLTRQVEQLFEAAQIEGMRPKEFIESIPYYGESYHLTLPQVPAVIASSIFFDGVLHGIAFGAGLVGQRRERKVSG